MRQRYIAVILFICKAENRGRTQNIVSKIMPCAGNRTANTPATFHKHGVDADSDTKAPLAAFSLQQGTNCFAQSRLSLHLEQPDFSHSENNKLSCFNLNYTRKSKDFQCYFSNYIPHQRYKTTVKANEGWITESQPAILSSTGGKKEHSRSVLNLFKYA